MEMKASYVLIDDETLDRLADAQIEVEEGRLEALALSNLIEEVTEDSAIEASLEEYWDIMHFLLTGADASEPEEGNPLSEAVAGQVALDTEAYSALTESERVEAIAMALTSFDFNTALAGFTLEAARKTELYPNIWEDDSKWEELVEDLSNCYALLRNFYQLAATNHANLLVTIQ